MKSFCISLEKQRDNWPELKKYFTENGVTDINMFSAINGKELGKYFENPKIENISQNTMDLIKKSGGLEKLVSTWGLYHLFNSTKRRDHAQLGSWGAVGCSLSHISIWEKIVEENLEMALIFEDDIDFKSDFKDKLPKVIANLPKDADIIFLDTVVNFKPLKHDDIFDKVLGQFFGTHSYIMTNKGAQKLLPYVYPVEIQIDAFMGYSASLNRVKIYSTKDMCAQKLHISSIQTTCVICDIDDKQIDTYTFLTKTFIILFVLIILVLIFFMFFNKGKKAGFRYGLRSP
jgi:GR25 family glycosyltransferase involved in LPS biosynthesis